MENQKKLGNSLPEINIPLLGQYTMCAGSISVSIGELIDVCNDFNLKWRGPLISTFLSVEAKLNSLLINLNLVINGIEFENYQSNIVLEIKHRIIYENTLSEKINLLFNYIIEIEKKFMKTKTPVTDLKKLIKNLKSDFNKYRINRNIIAHGQITPRVNNEKKIIDLYILYTEKVSSQNYLEKEKIINESYKNEILVNLIKTDKHLTNMGKLININK